MVHRQPAEALAAFESTLKKEPNRFRAVYGAARAASLSNDRAKARTYYTSLIAICKKADSPGRAELAEARKYLTSHPWLTFEFELKRASAHLWIALGGDGTMLRCGQLCGPAGVPVLGINLGRLGFLMGVQREEWPERLPRLFSGDYWLEPRMMLATLDSAGILASLSGTSPRRSTASGSTKAACPRATSGASSA